MSKKNIHAKASLLENEDVKELLGIMQESSVSTKNLLEVISYVSLMERQLDTAVSELFFMREEQNHPVRTALQKNSRCLGGYDNQFSGKAGCWEKQHCAGCQKLCRCNQIKRNFCTKWCDGLL